MISSMVLFLRRESCGAGPAVELLRGLVLFAPAKPPNVGAAAVGVDAAGAELDVSGVLAGFPPPNKLDVGGAVDAGFEAAAPKRPLLAGAALDVAGTEVEGDASAVAEFPSGAANSDLVAAGIDEDGVDELVVAGPKLKADFCAGAVAVEAGVLAPVEA